MAIKNYDNSQLFQITPNKLVQFSKKFRSKMIPLLFSVILLSIFSYFVWKHFTDDKKYAELPGPYMFPIIGSSFKFIGKTPTQLYDILWELSKQYGPTWKIKNGFDNTYVVLEDPKDVESVLSSQKLITKGADYKFVAVRI